VKINFYKLADFAVVFAIAFMLGVLTARDREPAICKMVHETEEIAKAVYPVTTSCNWSTKDGYWTLPCEEPKK